MKPSLILFFVLTGKSLCEGKLGKPRREDAQSIRASQRNLLGLTNSGPNPTSRYPLSRCQGDCDLDIHCEIGLVCFQRNQNVPVPGCTGNDGSRTDYCIDPSDLSSGPNNSPNPAPVTAPVPSPVPGPSGGNNPSLTSYGSNPPPSRKPLGACEGDCDSDSDCGPGLRCFQRNSFEAVPGCSGNDPSRTDYCVREGGGSDTGSQPTPTGSPPSSAPLSDFRLKLYWQPGYYWQEETFERKWCMECRGDRCNYGNKIYITHCDGGNQRFDFVEINSSEVLIRLHGRNLCFERVNKDIYMYPCDTNNSRQQWIAKRGDLDGGRFEISQNGFSNYCITQRHHPKDGEEVELEPCTQARSSDTSYWNRY